MKYSLYGLGEGLLADCFDYPYIVTNCESKIVDVSISARKLGIMTGMRQKNAQVLCPDIKIFPESQRVSKSMQQILCLSCAYTPWIQAERKDAFYMQLSGVKPPVYETRNFLMDVDRALLPEQRLRVGFAENPFLARLLVEWSQVERIPDALYCKVGRQQLIISPGLAVDISKKNRRSYISEWWGSLPIRAFWLLSFVQKEKLLKLRVRRLRDLNRIPERVLLDYFGKESLLWKQSLSQKPGGSIFVNYPTYEKKSTWIADIHDRPHISTLENIVIKLSQNLSSQLTHLHAGAMKVGIRWRSDLKEDESWQMCKRPLFRTSDILKRIQPFFSHAQGSSIEFVELWVADIQIISSVQGSFVLHKNQSHIDSRVIRTDMKDITSEIKTHFSNGVLLGVKPSSYELRLNEVSV